jgi:hypothetical protein
MADHSGVPEEDVSLPKATVAKMIQGLSSPVFCLWTGNSSNFPPPYPIELLPKDITCSKETRDIVIECCVGDFASLPPCAGHVDRAAEFIHLISSEANDICEKESKKTIAPDHILSALEASVSHGGCPTPQLTCLQM